MLAPRQSPTGRPLIARASCLKRCPYCKVRRPGVLGDEQGYRHIASRYTPCAAQIPDNSSRALSTGLPMFLPILIPSTPCDKRTAIQVAQQRITRVIVEPSRLMIAFLPQAGETAWLDGAAAAGASGATSESRSPWRPGPFDCQRVLVQPRLMPGPTGLSKGAAHDLDSIGRYWRDQLRARPVRTANAIMSRARSWGRFRRAAEKGSEPAWNTWTNT